MSIFFLQNNYVHLVHFWFILVKIAFQNKIPQKFTLINSRSHKDWFGQTAVKWTSLNYEAALSTNLRDVSSIGKENTLKLLNSVCAKCAEPGSPVSPSKLTPTRRISLFPFKTVT